MNEAEVWQSDHAWLKQEMDAEITKRKIHRLSFTHNGKPLLVEVGRSPAADAEQSVQFTYSDGSGPGSVVMQTNSPNSNPNGVLVENWTELQPIHH